MNVRGAAVQSGLAALGLVVAYGTWQREPERAPGEVVVVDASKSEVSKVRYSDDKGKTVELERRNESGEEPRIWLHLSGDATKKLPDREVPGNEGAQRLWDKFAPLHATRGLGVLPDAKLKELGLDAPKKKLEVTARGGQTTFDIGASPFGVSDPYVRDQHDKRVYVLGGGVLSDLDSASVRLVDRTLHGFKPGDYDGLTVAAGGKSHELTVPASENAFQAKLVGKNGKPDEQAKNWHDKIWRTTVIEVLGKGENPKAGTPELVCKLSYSWKNKPKGFLELGRLPAPAPTTATSSQPPASDVWSKSEHTASWVKLSSTAEALLTECAKVAATE
jgi:hypothetical protein